MKMLVTLILSVLLLIQPSYADVCPVCSNYFGGATNANVYVSQDATVGGADSAGAVLVAGNLNIPNGFTSASQSTSFSVVVGGNLVIGGSLVSTGDVHYGGTRSGQVYFNGQGSLKQTIPVNFPQITAQVAGLSTFWSTLQTTGTTSFAWGTTTLTCGSQATQVFSMDGANFNSAGYFSLKFSQCSGSQIIIVNIFGSSAVIQNGQADMGSTPATNVIFNFYQATNIQITSTNVLPTIIAPNALVQGSQAQVGQIFAKSLSGSSSFEFHYQINGQNGWFNGCAPSPCSTVAPTTVAPTVPAPTTIATTASPSTAAPTVPPTIVTNPTSVPTTQTTQAPTTVVPTTAVPTTVAPTTAVPTTVVPTTVVPTTVVPTTAAPTTVVPTTAVPTTVVPTTAAPTTVAPTTAVCTVPTTAVPTTAVPTTTATTVAPSTAVPTTVAPTTAVPTTVVPTTVAPTTVAPTTAVYTTAVPTTVVPTTTATTVAPSTAVPTTVSAPTTTAPTSTVAPTTVTPTTIAAPTTLAATAAPSTVQATTIAPTQSTTQRPTTRPPTKAPTTKKPTTKKPTPAPTTKKPTPTPTTRKATSTPTTVVPTATIPYTTGVPVTTGVPTTPVVYENGTCANTTCGVGLSCCDDLDYGAMCYPRSGYTCNNLTNGQNRLCGFQEHGPDSVCGKYCYDFIDYVCCNETIYNLKASNIPAGCPVPPSNLNTTKEVCGGIECDSNGYLCCDSYSNPRCYWPAAQTCLEGSNGPQICGLYDSVCGTTCYDPDYFVCIGTQITEKNQNSSPPHS